MEAITFFEGGWNGYGNKLYKKSKATDTDEGKKKEKKQKAPRQRNLKRSATWPPPKN
jgi:hypothetical protein